MARKRIDPRAIEEEVAALGDLSLVDLRQRWQQLFGNPAPRSLRRALLIKACAYQLQVKAFGGLSAATKRRLRAVADAARTGAAIPTATTLKIKPGTRLVRAWGGEVHTVTALARGFDYAGKRYRSLSAIAKEITGTNWNGHLFFGLKQGRIASADEIIHPGNSSSDDGSGDPRAMNPSGPDVAPPSRARSSRR